MPDANGDAMRLRMEQLEEMDKLLLRAQVLQQRALEILEQNVSRHDEWLSRHEQAIAEHDQWKREQRERDRVIDDRIDKLVSAIGE